MKHLFILLIGGTLLTACGKVSNSQLAGDWKVAKYEEKYEYRTNNSAYNVDRTISHDGSNYVINETSNGENLSSVYQLKQHTFTFEKRGTFRTLFNIQNNLSEVIKSEDSGIWYFASKSPKNEIGKNELLNLITENHKYLRTVGTTTMEDVNTIFENSASATIYKVISAKNKQIELEVFTEEKSGSTTSSTKTYYLLEK